MARVEAKVTRSRALLASLDHEQHRWAKESASFADQMATVVGDVLLGAACIAYGGFFDQTSRSRLAGAWRAHLHRAGLECRDDLSVIEYLSTADQRAEWHTQALPADDLCAENAVMLTRYNRYPLVIDPSGQAAEFLANHYTATTKTGLVRTSFLDESFRKTLESALRFGTPLLVQDAENYDPVLNPVLNRELRRAGGRVLIRLGDQDIDFSPAFTCILATRDPTANFSPDLCSRVTFVNFTVTPASLLSQCLHQALQVERPDIEQKRTDMLKMQGAFAARLRHLEKGLLDALSGAQGAILDDDTVMQTLETLKHEAGVVAGKAHDIAAGMAELESVTAQYSQFAARCSAVYFALEQLAAIHYLYQFSLDRFLGVFTHILTNNPNLAAVTDPAARLAVLNTDLFAVTFGMPCRAVPWSTRSLRR
jgi:dynein heavy chain 1